MKKVLPVLLIALGIAEIVMGIMDVKMPIIIALVLGVLLVGIGIKTLLEGKIRIQISVGRLISIIGILILCTGLLCNAFEWISNTAFRIIVLVGIITQVTAFIVAIKKNEF